MRRFDLPAKAVVQSQFLVAGTPPSQASQLPHEIPVATKIPDLPPTPCGSGGATIRLARESGVSVATSGGRYTAIAGKPAPTCDPCRNQNPGPATSPLWERRCDDSTCSRKRCFSRNLWWQVHRFRRQASSHMRSMSQPKSRTCHRPPVGAAVRRFDLPAKAVVQSQFLVAGAPPSQASQLPHEVHVATKIPDLSATPCVRACPRKRWFSRNFWWQVHRHRRQARLLQTAGYCCN